MSAAAPVPQHGELGSAASTGSITGIGSQFVLFQAFDVDTGAKWLMTGANTLGSVATIGLSGTGSLGVTGTLTAPTNLTITGTGTLAANGGGRIEVGTAGTAVANQIAVDAAHTLTTSGVLSAATLAVASGGLPSVWDADGHDGECGHGRGHRRHARPCGIG